MLETIQAPWTEDQVRQLNLFQRSGLMHPFTCPWDGHSQLGWLIATTDGWVCQVTENCDYTQRWAHAFMGDPDAFETLLRSSPWYDND